MSESNWGALVSEWKAQQDASQADLWPRRRDFLVRMGIDRHNWKTHRLRPQDGLSEEAWWVAVKGAIDARKKHGVRMVGKRIGK